MALETATFIGDLDGNNPPGTDLKSQGDDHLRLIKNVLKNSLKRVTRAFYVPGSVSKSANYSVLAADDNLTFICDTTSSFTLTLPTLISTDAGWCIYVQKSTTDANPVFIAPPSGTINGFSKVRRSIEYLITKVTWNGSAFVATRANGVPVGSCVEYHGGSLPNGYLWPDGTTFTAANYVELNTVLGTNTKPDRKGRIAVGKDDMGGSAANRVTTAGSGVDGVTLGASGGTQNVVLSQANLPDVALPVTDSGHVHGGVPNASGNGVNALGAFGALPNAMTNSSSATTGISVRTGGSGTAVSKMPPSFVANFILVAE